MPTRLLPRVGERPAGADLGVLEPRDTLLMSVLAGDLGFRMDRGRDSPSLLLGRAGVEMDLVRIKEGDLKKSLL